jgi:hypothetical protein
MIKVWTKFLSKMCSEGNKLRNRLRKWKRRNETRSYDWMISDEKVYHTVNGKITEHGIISKERRLTFEPVGYDEIP